MLCDCARVRRWGDRPSSQDQQAQSIDAVKQKLGYEVFLLPQQYKRVMLLRNRTLTERMARRHRARHGEWVDLRETPAHPVSESLVNVFRPLPY